MGSAQAALGSLLTTEVLWAGRLPLGDTRLPTAFLALQAPRGWGWRGTQVDRTQEAQPLCSWLLWGPPHCALQRGALGPAVTSLCGWRWLALGSLPTHPSGLIRPSLSALCLSEPAL